MAMEFTKCIGELLKKNGVTPKITEYSGISQTDKTFETRYGVSIDDLDFSEHDKAFENEIAGLKAKIAIKDMDYKTASELLGKYQQENESLKQRIAELESKETEKPTKINLNDRIKVKLTPLGAEIYYHMFDDTNKKAKKTIIEPHLPKVDEKGYTEFTLWGFINTYGQYIDVGKPDVIDPIDIIACE
jgi:hypothetical protein